MLVVNSTLMELLVLVTHLVDWSTLDELQVPLESGLNSRNGLPSCQLPNSPSEDASLRHPMLLNGVLTSTMSWVLNGTTLVTMDLASPTVKVYPVITQASTVDLPSTKVKPTLQVLTRLANLLTATLTLRLAMEVQRLLLTGEWSLSHLVTLMMKSKCKESLSQASLGQSFSTLLLVVLPTILLSFSPTFWRSK